MDPAVLQNVLIPVEGDGSMVALVPVRDASGNVTLQPGAPLQYYDINVDAIQEASRQGRPAPTDVPENFLGAMERIAHAPTPEAAKAAHDAYNVLAFSGTKLSEEEAPAVLRILIAAFHNETSGRPVAGIEELIRAAGEVFHEFVPVSASDELVIETITAFFNYLKYEEDKGTLPDLRLASSMVAIAHFLHRELGRNEPALWHIVETLPLIVSLWRGHMQSGYAPAGLVGELSSYAAPYKTWNGEQHPAKLPIYAALRECGAVELIMRADRVDDHLLLTILTHDPASRALEREIPQLRTQLNAALARYRTDQMRASSRQKQILDLLEQGP